MVQNANKTQLLDTLHQCQIALRELVDKREKAGYCTAFVERKVVFTLEVAPLLSFYKKLEIEAVDPTSTSTLKSIEEKMGGKDIFMCLLISENTFEFEQAKKQLREALNIRTLKLEYLVQLVMYFHSRVDYVYRNLLYIDSIFEGEIVVRTSDQFFDQFYTDCTKNQQELSFLNTLHSSLVWGKDEAFAQSVQAIELFLMGKEELPEMIQLISKEIFPYLKEVSR